MIVVDCLQQPEQISGFILGLFHSDTNQYNAGICLLLEDN